MASKLIAANVARTIAATGNKLHFSCGSFRQHNRAAILQQHFYFGKGRRLFGSILISYTSDVS